MKKTKREPMSEAKKAAQGWDGYGEPPYMGDKWQPEYNTMIVEWMSGEDPFRENETEKGNVQIIPHKLPTFEGFARKIGVQAGTMLDWAKEENRAKYPGFREAYAVAKDAQKEFLLQQGAAGAGSPQFAMFVLKNGHGMKDTTDHTNDGGRFSELVIVNGGGSMSLDG